MTKRDRTRSDAIVKAHMERKPKLLRKNHEFSGTWKASPEEVFPLLCPAREADWIPGWTAKVLYSSSGYAEDMCVFETDETCTVGPGLWTFTGFKKNEHVQFVRFERDSLTHALITVKDNGDGTTTATWHVTMTALNEKGNEKFEKMPTMNHRATGIVKMVEHYLEKGGLMEPSLLARLHDAIKGH